MKLLGFSILVLLAGFSFIPALMANSSSPTMNEATFVVG